MKNIYIYRSAKSGKVEKNPSQHMASSSRTSSSSLMKLHGTIGYQGVMQLMRDLSSAPGGVIQLTRMSKGIEYATDEKDAVKWLSEHVEGFDTLGEEDQAMAVNVAMDKSRGVLQAKQMMEASNIEELAKANREKREGEIDEDYNTYSDAFGNDLANAVFKVAKDAFVGGNTNVSIAGTYTQQEVDDAIEAWKQYLEGGNLTDNITNVHFFNGEDKAAAGKGNVGDTLATRGVQANFISTWMGRKINVHVDMKE